MATKDHDRYVFPQSGAFTAVTLTIEKIPYKYGC